MNPMYYGQNLIETHHKHSYMTDQAVNQEPNHTEKKGALLRPSPQSNWVKYHHMDLTNSLELNCECQSKQGHFLRLITDLRGF